MTDSLQREMVPHPRRVFLRNGTLWLTAAATTNPEALWAEEAATPLRIGLLTDLHHADKPSAGTRYYRETRAKLAEAARQYAQDQPSFLVELGDLIDAADSVETELGYLQTINREFSSIAGERHYVLGNHCVDTLTKQEFLEAVEQPRSYYSFDRGQWHCIVLDSCFRRDGTAYGRKNFQWTDANIPDEELEWLRADLQSTTRNTVVFAHQRLDVSNNHGVRNGLVVREILEKSGRVRAVFQGHSHKNDLMTHNGVHYCTLRAMVEGSGAENSGYGLLELASDGALRLQGFRQQADYRWNAAS